MERKARYVESFQGWGRFLGFVSTESMPLLLLVPPPAALPVATATAAARPPTPAGLPVAAATAAIAGVALDVWDADAADDDSIRHPFLFNTERHQLRIPRSSDLDVSLSKPASGWILDFQLYGLMRTGAAEQRQTPHLCKTRVKGCLIEARIAEEGDVASWMLTHVSLWEPIHSANSKFSTWEADKDAATIASGGQQQQQQQQQGHQQQQTHQA